MIQTIKPLILVSDKNVVINGLDEKKKCKVEGGHPAATKLEKDGNMEKYTIDFDLDVIEDLYFKTWASSHITFEEFVCGLQLHEVSHIRYGSFSIATENDQNKLFAYIKNVLEDSRIEYQLTLEFPQYAPYLDWVLIAMKLNLSLDNVGISDEEKAKFSELLKQFYELIRFGTIRKGCDEEFINFLLPVALSSVRGAPISCYQATIAVASYLTETVLKNPNDAPKLCNGKIEVKAENQKRVDNVTNKTQQVMNNNVTKLAGNDMKPDVSRGDTTIELEEEENQFYKMTVEKYHDIIFGLRNVFKRHFNRLVTSPSYDGDINVLKQQDAYLNSITMQTASDYTKTYKEEQSIDLVVIRDISGSTFMHKVEYAEASVCLLASLEKLPGVRTAQIDFSDDHIVIKRFEEDLKVSRIFPRSVNGTVVSSSLNELYKMKWRGKHKLVFIVTDGNIEDIDNGKRIMQALKQKHQIKFKRINVSSSGANFTKDDGLVNCSFDNLPNAITKLIIEGEQKWN